MVIDGNYTCGEHSIMCKEFESLYYIPETNATSRVNYIQIKKNLNTKFASQANC